MTKPRGRPRSFDEGTVRNAIMRAFWKKGYSSATLDDLTEATELVRPSLKGAFGSKRDMFFMSLDTYMDHLSPARELLQKASTLEEALDTFFVHMIELYFDENPDAPMGCFLVGAVLTEAPSDPALRDALNKRLALLNEMLDSAIVKHCPDAQPDDIQVAADQASAVLHSMAVRVRSGDDKVVLVKFAKRMVRVICSVLHYSEK